MQMEGKRLWLCIHNVREHGTVGNAIGGDDEKQFIHRDIYSLIEYVLVCHPRNCGQENKIVEERIAATEDQYGMEIMLFFPANSETSDTKKKKRASDNVRGLTWICNDIA